jgi:hypothetical protein
VVNRETSFHEQFLDVPIRKREPQIPTDRANNDLGFEVPPFERAGRGLIMEYIAAYQTRSLSFCNTAVRSPYGEIPWPRLSRLSDEEMKALMIDVVNKTYRALTVLFDNRLGGELIKILAQQDFLPRWNEPTLS